MTLQLGLLFDAPPAPAAPVPPRASDARVSRGPARGRAARRAQEARLLHRLNELGLRGIERVALMRTRRTMVSIIGGTLRVHDGYVDAPEVVLRAIVTFATARTRVARAQARDVILQHDVPRPPPKRRPEAERPGDAGLLALLAEAHRALNDRHFGGALGTVPVRLSGRMKSRLGHYSPAGDEGEAAEIAISRRHVRRDGWAEAMHTLLHEMVHQWQDENGHPLDHGAAFRRKAREVGVLPQAKRRID